MKSGIAPQTIKTVGIIGAGTMGHGIAQVAAAAGYQAVLRDVDRDSLARGIQAIERNLLKGIQLAKLTEADRDSILQHIHGTTDLAEVATADLVIEAAPENLEIKQQLIQDVEKLASQPFIFASNTSSLSITELAKVSAQPGNVVGMHFFNPVHIMRLVEIVVGKATSDDTVELVRQVAQRLRKEPIVVQDVPGFASSRLGVALGLEAMRMLEQGVASAKDIDTAMELGYNHPMGPLKLTDHVGLDIRLNIAEYLYRELGSETFRPPELLRRMVQEGKLGKKTGIGFYDWTAPAEDRRSAYSS
ncbi:MAG TPA: 3-hydroxyacyl-CoA dehydrogenase family protein [Pyrinomonadaceae bacterium]|nr:3-hydroxyacyl-CoA dehydrogenase family protein [Pyrinomonadaceae bacterium]